MAAKKISPLMAGLLISVALNGILIGLLASAKNGQHPRENSPRPNHNAELLDIANISRSLPVELRGQFTALLTPSDKESIKDAFNVHHRRQRELTALIRADVVDIEAIKLAMSDIRDSRKHISALGDDKMLPFILTLSSQERQSIVRRLNTRRGGGGDKSEGQKTNASRGLGSMGEGSMGDMSDHDTKHNE